MTAHITSEESRRVERVAKIAALSGAALAPVIAVPLAFGGVERAMAFLGFTGELPGLGWRLAIGFVSALWAVAWTARHVPEMVRAGLREHVAGEDRR